MHTTSVSLLERLRLPADHAAWDRFVDLYTPLLFHWARRAGLQESDAADLIQDVFQVLLRKMPEFTYDRDGSFRAWLRTVLLNQWRMRLRRRPEMPLNDAQSRLIDEGAQNTAAEKAGLIHRDVKPDNIWLEAISDQRSALAESCPLKAFRVKILDFGLARPAADDAHLIQEGAIVGTPAYMSPEQVGGRTVDARADLFSLGCVLYRMTTGTLPFKGADTIAILMAVATESPRPVQDLNPVLPSSVCVLIERLLAKNPDERPHSAGEVVDMVQAIESDAAGCAS